MKISKLNKTILSVCLFLSLLSPICFAEIPVQSWGSMTPEEREAWMDNEQEQFNKDYAAAQRRINEGWKEQARARENFGKFGANMDTVIGLAAGGWVLKAIAVVFGLGCLSKIANRKQPERIIIRESNYRPRNNNQNNNQKKKNNNQNQQKKQNNSGNQNNNQPKKKSEQNTQKQNTANNATKQKNQTPQQPAQNVDQQPKKNRRRKKKKKQPQQEEK